MVTLGLAMAPAAKPSTEQAKPQDPFLLRAFVQLHNVFLIALSSYMFGGSIYEAWMNGYNFWGNAYDVSQVGMGRVIYVFYMSKWYEFFDTVSAATAVVPSPISCACSQCHVTCNHGTLLYSIVCFRLVDSLDWQTVV